MEKLEIILIVSVIEVGHLEDFDLEELSELWSALTVCMDDECFFASFDEKQQTGIKAALEKVEKELKRRHAEPVNFFKLMQDNPAKVEFYLKQFDLQKLLDLAADLKDYQNSQIVADFLKLVNQQIYRIMPVA